MNSPPATAKSSTPLIGLLLLGVALLMMCSAATQYLAWQFNYHPALGRPWVGKLYAPWAWLSWQQAYYQSAGPVFNLVVCHV